MHVSDYTAPFQSSSSLVFDENYIHSSTKRLHDISLDLQKKSLGHEGPTNGDLAEVLSEVKDILHDQMLNLVSVPTIQNEIDDLHDVSSVEELRAAANEALANVFLSDEDNGIQLEAYFKEFESSVSAHGESILDYLQHTIEIIDDIQGTNSDGEDTSARGNGEIDSSSNPQGSADGTSGGQPTGSARKGPQPSFPFYFGQASNRKSRLARITHVDFLRAQNGDHRSRQRRLEEDGHPNQCFMCPVDDKMCNCRRLQECAKDLTSYDMAVRVLGGFVSFISLVLVFLACSILHSLLD